MKSGELLYLRETLMVIHLIYQGFMLLVQLDQATRTGDDDDDDAAAASGSGAKSLSWQHSLVSSV